MPRRIAGYLPGMTFAVTPADREAHPKLNEIEMVRLASYGRRARVEVGDLVFEAGQDAPDLILVHDGSIAVVQPATPLLDEEILDRFGAGEFIGELNLLTGQRIFLDGRVTTAGTVTLIDRAAFRRVMAEDPELSDLMLRAFVSRRRFLSAGRGSRSIEIIGDAADVGSLRLRTYAARQRIAHTWIDVSSARGGDAAARLDIAATDLPAVLLPDAVLHNAAPGDLAVLWVSRTARMLMVRRSTWSWSEGVRRDWLRPSTAPQRVWTRWCLSRSRWADRPRPVRASRTSSDSPLG